ncbi:hypothetical protein DPX39_060043800 [Trypanosoma brucei equiperdum]|uniref:Uncharacterized protein n=1 Tax=Trypanosoma brucei equiperdum TaxID=630700 RepID=A0A3L6LBT7_9TRYP|nr:hypothetical protein DPX39_060043800 [Trypanosoma brucei equiperdum]
MEDPRDNPNPRNSRSDHSGNRLSSLRRHYHSDSEESDHFFPEHLQVIELEPTSFITEKDAPLVTEVFESCDSSEDVTLEAPVGVEVELSGPGVLRGVRIPTGKVKEKLDSKNKQISRLKSVRNGEPPKTNMKLNERGIMSTKLNKPVMRTRELNSISDEEYRR